MRRPSLVQWSAWRWWGLADWLEGQAQIQVPAPGSRLDYVLGRLGEVALLLLGLQVLTGFWLLAHYSPDARGALISVQALDHEVWGGWWCRRLHAAGGMLLLLVALGRGGMALVKGLGGQGGRGVWLSGGLLAALLGALHLSGLFLPRSQAGLGILARLWGEAFREDAGGGAGAPLALHLTLPLALLVLGWFHVGRVRLGAGGTAGAQQRLEPAWPQGWSRLAMLLGSVLALWLGLALIFPNLLLLTDLPPGQASQVPGALPWYLWAPAALARWLPAGLGLLLSLLLGASLLLWPWWDAGSRVPLLHRPLAGKLALTLATAWLLLSLAGWWEGRP